MSENFEKNTKNTQIWDLSGQICRNFSLESTSFSKYLKSCQESVIVTIIEFHFLKLVLQENIEIKMPLFWQLFKNLF